MELALYNLIVFFISSYKLLVKRLLLFLNSIIIEKNVNMCLWDQLTIRVLCVVHLQLSHS